MSEAKILVFDIETAPIKGLVWALWKQNIAISQIERDWFILNYSAKWLGNPTVLWDALPEHKKTYKKDPTNDKEVVRSLWKLLDEADIVIAHNADRFDVAKVNTRFLYHGFDPPRPFKVIDTLKIAKSEFGFTSNKLDYLAQFLGIGQKLKHEGQELWNRCLAGDLKAWDKMIEYCNKDSLLLEKVYYKLRPWHKRHPSIIMYGDGPSDLRHECPTCGSPNIRPRGYYSTNVSKFKRFRCDNCGKWSRARVSVLKKDRKDYLLTNII